MSAAAPKYEYGKKPPSKTRRRVRKLTKRTFILFIVAISAGLLYTYISGRSEPAINDLSAEVKPTNNPYPTPPEQAPDTPVGVSVMSITSPVRPGDNTAINIRTNPEAECTVKVEYAGAVVVDSGLAAKQANAYGAVSWSWTVAATAPEGDWPVTVFCKRYEKSGMVVSQLRLRKQLGETAPR